LLWSPQKLGAPNVLPGTVRGLSFGASFWSESDHSVWRIHTVMAQLVIFMGLFHDIKPTIVTGVVIPFITVNC
jgi:hypothetical protein